MKRDMDLVRAILLSEEEDSNKYLDRYSPAQIGHHVEILADAGLIVGSASAVVGDKYPINYSIRRLTWSGHEFLAAAKDDTIWNKAKEKILKPATSWTFSILLEYLKAEAKQQLGVLDAN